MCTAISLQTADHYFGRTLDLSYSYGETVAITPRHYPFHFRKMGTIDSHYAIIGMAIVREGYPLYYDAANEKGLAIAGLNFPGNAVYFPEKDGKDNVAPFELIPWILGQCATLEDARRLLERIHLADIPFSESMPLAPLHWMIGDKTGTITMEQTADGLKIYDNPVGVLTNNPPFDYQMFNLSNYMNLTAEPPVNRFCPELPLRPYCLGMGGLGLPGDLSSTSRFVRAAFTRLNSVCGCSESESVSQFFHILGSVHQTRGSAKTEDGYEITVYTSCCNTSKGIYYYTTYENQQITAVRLANENLDGCSVISYPLITGQQILSQN